MQDFVKDLMIKIAAELLGQIVKLILTVAVDGGQAAFDFYRWLRGW